MTDRPTNSAHHGTNEAETKLQAIAHEIRNHLYTIHTGVLVLNINSEKTSEMTELYDSIDGAQKAIFKLVENMLKVALDQNEETA